MSFQFPFNIPEAKFQELEKFILNQIRQNVDIQKELIPEIAIRMDWDWDKSKKLVEYVTEDHKKEIALFSRSIFLLIICTGLLVFVSMIGGFIHFFGYQELFSCKEIVLSRLWQIFFRRKAVDFCLMINSEYITGFVLFLIVSLLVMLVTILSLFGLVRYLRKREIKG